MFSVQALSEVSLSRLTKEFDLLRFLQFGPSVPFLGKFLPLTI